ncbi:triacylglycerol lipase [Cryptococcus neoformans]|nr:triacylglycerol lipase [Cryptococcus neoformans var. grubii Th84]OXH02968.1 triacylglycerol lipase [Cryptococcus neoformans var. grubii]OXH24778.1 triacylglycerol lipase [Cryptococcus neoformans var. grubii]OXH44788.1 triacylglycerol lipase [Cryptococcus neoformans var. grubii]OXH45595.1 triacylglycerol lipase [Cryptococcus neoformans var. grubii]
MPPRAPRILYHPIKAMSHPHKVGNSARQTLNSQSRSDIRHHQQPPSTETADEAAKSRRKGKQRADPLLIQRSHGKEREIEGSDSSVPALIDEAIHTSISPTSLSSSLESSFDRTCPSPIPEPPRVHYPPSLRPRHPRLLSQLARSTLPTASVSRPSLERSQHGRRWSVSESMVIGSGEGSSSWQRSVATTALSDEPFPDLDPTTGLPLELSSHRRGSTSSDAPSLHLQRTITELLSSPTAKSAGEPSVTNIMPNFNFSLPRVSFPSKPSLDFGKRNFSTSSSQDDWGSWASGWWSGNKGKVDEMMSEEDKADTVEEEKEKLRKKYRSPKHPVVFCHGLLGFDYLGPASMPPLQISHWRGIREVLESNGVEVLIARVPATSSIKDRARILADFISEKYPGREINLIGHSMGGLDCRYLVSQIKDKSFKPISLTTISTPHRGSPFADYLIDNVIGRERLPSLLGLLETMRLPQSGDGSAFSALGTNSMKEFNTEVVDSEDVKYYSWGASFNPGLLDTFKWPHSIIYAKEGANDGLVSVHSAMWGEYRGTLVGVNHLDLVGWVNTVRYAVAGWTGKPIAFKPATFYLEVTDYLAEQGF